MRRLLLQVLGLLGCVAPTSPDFDPVIPGEWDIAQRLVAEAKWDARAYYVSWDLPLFTWETHDGVFLCGDVQANGCYTPKASRGGHIEWNTQTPTVVRHEAAHAILRYLGYSDWREWEHGE